MSPLPFLPARIVSKRRIAPAFVHLVLEAPHFCDGYPSAIAYIPGQEIVVDVLAGTQRKYSVFRRDPRNGRVELLVFVHGRGRGADWAASALAGDTVRVTSWRGARIVCDPSARDVVFLGDETAIAPFAAIQRVSPGRGLIEGDAHLGAVLSFAGLPLEPTPKGESAMLAYARNLAAHEDTVVYVAGSAKMVNGIRDVLAAKGIERVRAKAFWGKPRHAL